jgi:hypothetical protein
MKFKRYVHHASREAPQYIIKGDKTEHVAIHKGTALRQISTRARKSRGTKKAKKVQQANRYSGHFYGRSDLIARFVDSPPGHWSRWWRMPSPRGKIPHVMPWS